MNNKFNLIIAPFHDYKKWIKEGFRTRDSHLFLEFQKNKNVNKILIINRPVSLAEMMIKRRNWKTNIGNNVCNNKNWQINVIDTKTFILDIFSTDFFEVIWENKKWWNTIFCKESTINIINTAIKELNFEDNILFIENPMAIGLAQKVENKKFVFDAIDNWLYHPQMKKIEKIVQKNYEYVKNNADLICTVSESLKDFFSTNSNNVTWIPNGVEIDRFSEAIVYDENKRKKPVIGYMGKIQDRVDFSLIEKCLNEFDNDFLIMGPIYSQKKSINYLKRKYKNIKFTGDIHYNDLPKKMYEFDIAIIPHKVDKFTNSMSPLKIYEYLAAGKQVITTKIAGYEEFDKYVYASNDYQEFISNIEKAIDNYKNIKNISIKVKDEVKYENTWENRAKILMNNIIRE